MARKKATKSVKPDRTYYVFFEADDPTLNSVADYELGSYPMDLHWCGKRIRSIPKDLTIELDEGDRSDLLGNPLGMLIVSARLKNKIARRCGSTVQFLPLPMRRKGKVVNGYFLANPLGRIKALKGRTQNIQQLKLHNDRIPPDRHLFVLEADAPIYIISDVLFNDLRGKGLKGLAALEILK